MSKVGDDYVPPSNVNLDDLPFSCQWILSVLNRAIFKTIAGLESYKFSNVANTVYSWWQYQLCDVFIEAIKPFFAGDTPWLCKKSMGYDCFILLSWIYGRMMEAPSFIKGLDKQESSVQVSRSLDPY